MRGEADIPDHCPATGTDGKEAFERTCLNWPQNLPGRNTGGCCWQWRQKP